MAAGRSEGMNDVPIVRNERRARGKAHLDGARCRSEWPITDQGETSNLRVEVDYPRHEGSRGGSPLSAGMAIGYPEGVAEQISSRGTFCVILRGGAFRGMRVPRAGPLHPKCREAKPGKRPRSVE